MIDLQDDDDVPRTLIFVDMLGWAKFTEDHPRRSIDIVDSDNPGWSGRVTSALSRRITRFQSVLQECVRAEMQNGGINSMVFSDCAFVDVGSSLRAALTAVNLMRMFIKSGVPVRMGLGKGTFYTFKFGMDSVDRSTNANLSFAGTAVVWSHQAESCGGKGMRIFLHPTLRSDFTAIRQRVRILEFTSPFANAIAELDYMENQDEDRNPERTEDQEELLYGSVWSIKPGGLPAAVELHYSETLDAMNRMRDDRGKPKIVSPRWVPGLKDD